jgi:hypothetical protein
MHKSYFNAAVLLTSWIVFFVAQVFILKEIPLTVLALVLCALLLWNREPGEGILYALGLVSGLIIEVGLGQIARTQHWENASLLGVPYWLPLLWGYGFVVMRRVGNAVVSWSVDRN